MGLDSWEKQSTLCPNLVTCHNKHRNEYKEYQSDDEIDSDDSSSSDEEERDPYDDSDMVR